MRHRERLDRHACGLADPQRAADVGVRQQQAEFLAAIARGKTDAFSGDSGQRFAEPRADSEKFLEFQSFTAESEA
jgi:hypothetical protein